MAIGNSIKSIVPNPFAFAMWYALLAYLYDTFYKTDPWDWTDYVAIFAVTYFVRRNT